MDRSELVSSLRGMGPEVAEERTYITATKPWYWRGAPLAHHIMSWQAGADVRYSYCDRIAVERTLHGKDNVDFERVACEHLLAPLVHDSQWGRPLYCAGEHDQAFADAVDWVLTGRFRWEFDAPGRTAAEIWELEHSAQRRMLAAIDRLTETCAILAPSASTRTDVLRAALLLCRDYGWSTDDVRANVGVR